MERIIPFPGSKKDNVIELKVKANLLRGGRPTLSTQSRRVQQVMVSGALATVLFLVTLMNFSMNFDGLRLRTSQNEMGGRGPASISLTDTAELSKWSPSLLSRLNSKAKRELASIGTRATEMDQLRFGLLEGKYSIRMQENKIVEISFLEAVGQDDRPKFIGPKADFLVQNRELLKTDFVAAAAKSEVIDSGKIVETFELIGPRSGSVGKATFTSDEFGRLMNMRIE